MRLRSDAARSATPARRTAAPRVSAAVLAALAPLAVAQPTTADDRAQVERLEEVRITATPLRRREFETAQPVLVLGGEDRKSVV